MRMTEDTEAWEPTLKSGEKREWDKRVGRAAERRRKLLGRICPILRGYDLKGSHINTITREGETQAMGKRMRRERKMTYGLFFPLALSYYSFFISLHFGSLQPAFWGHLFFPRCPPDPRSNPLIHIHPSVHLSIHPFTHPIIHASIHPFFHSFIPLHQSISW